MRRIALVTAVILTGCYTLPAGERPALTSFEVTVLGVYERVGANRNLLRVVTTCATQYGGEVLVPQDVRGQAGCQYAIPRGEIEIDIQVRSLNKAGSHLDNFGGPVSFRVVPGELSGDYSSRWGLMAGGTLKATVKSRHQYGATRVWAEDAPVQIFYDGGIVGGTIGELPPDNDRVFGRTYATGVSRELHFEDQTLQSLQLPDGFDNRSSPFVGEFVVVGKHPESGQTLTQSCVDDPERNGRDALMVVTGLDPGGFFVSDLTACRLKEWVRDSAGATQVRTPELPEACQVSLPDGGAVDIEASDAGTGACRVARTACARRSDCAGYLPGTFASMYVYNFSFPDGLSQGDLLFTLSGSVQEFTSTTQLTFPSWIIAEKVRELPPEQWNKWLDYITPTVIGGRTCGMDDNPVPFVTDGLCGHNRRNLKMESLESGLVRLRRVRFPDTFVNCDFNGDLSVPFFCEQTEPQGSWIWGSCAFGEVEAEADRIERQCNQDCVIGMGAQTGKRCAESATFVGFGQYPVELAPPGPAWAGLDDSLPSRFQTFAVAPAPASDGGMSADGGVPTFSVRLPAAIAAGNEAVIVCDVPVHYAFGDATVVATAAEPVLAAKALLRHDMAPGQGQAALLAQGAAGTCSASMTTRTRFNIVTKDALPGLEPNCSLADPDAEKARQCQLLREASFDVVGHLRHLQPGRPRWAVLPRDADDLCCYPGPEQECPRPIAPCKSSP